MLNREQVKKTLQLVADDADFEEFEKHMAREFCYEFMGTQPYTGKWQGVDAVKRQFTDFNKNFTSPFKVKITELYIDAEMDVATVRLHSYPLTDLNGGEYRQHCVWFVYFNKDGKITKIIDYSDTTLVNEMMLRVDTAKKKKLQ